MPPPPPTTRATPSCIAIHRADQVTMDSRRQTSSTPPSSTPSCSRSRRSSLAHRTSTPSLTVDECHHRAEPAASIPTHCSGELPPLPPCLAGSPLNVGPVGEDVGPMVTMHPRLRRAKVMGRSARFHLWARPVLSGLGPNEA
jgi:hypothetical protein